MTFTKTEWPCISKMRAQHKEVRFSVTSEEVPGEGASGEGARNYGSCSVRKAEMWIWVLNN